MADDEEVGREKGREGGGDLADNSLLPGSQRIVSLYAGVCLERMLESAA